MKVTVDWIKDYCPVTLGIDELCQRLTMGVAPLESSSALPDGDHVLELEITSNRGDLMGVLGVAREVHAITGTPLRLPDISYSTVSKKVDEVARVTVEDPELCPRYIARVVEGIKVGPSPAWLTRRLESVGLRSVNNVVDVTNFVCLEYGQPLHAFDLDRLAGSRIIVRRARAGEAMATLDGKKQALSPERLVIADEKDSVAIAGVMGGQDSEVTTDTTRILLESASFDAASIRRTARSLAMSTESSNRFGRGVAWDGVDQASRRAIALLLQVAGGEALQGEIDVAAPGEGDSSEITLRFEQIPRLTGVSIPADQAVSILESLGCAVVARREDSVTVSAPGHRRDLGREADLIEEVLRIFGYENVSENPKLTFFPVVQNLLESYRAEVQDLMIGFGYREVLTLTFAAPEADL
ncbi:MAG: phenylalanine--tRNA ligase subunit beta, partial [Planctomycetota bacterium]|nr:phenylalanine--tRNA ligase subunit beta [Planctomycetota bacterium]